MYRGSDSCQVFGTCNYPPGDLPCQWSVSDLYFFQVIPNKRVEYPILALLGWLKILGSVCGKIYGAEGAINPGQLIPELLSVGSRVASIVEIGRDCQ